VDFSIGISRLIPKLIASGIIDTEQETPALVLVTTQNAVLMPYYIEIAKNLRANHIKTEIYLAQKPLSIQMKCASKKGFKFAIIANELEFANQQVILRSLSDGQQQPVSINKAIEVIEGA
jgi:histidyl-tRNA synthetase